MVSRWHSFRQSIPSAGQYSSTRCRTTGSFLQSIPTPLSAIQFPGLPKPDSMLSRDAPECFKTLFSVSLTQKRFRRRSRTIQYAVSLPAPLRGNQSGFRQNTPHIPGYTETRLSIIVIATIHTPDDGIHLVEDFIGRLKFFDFRRSFFFHPVPCDFTHQPDGCVPRTVHHACRPKYVPIPVAALWISPVHAFRIPSSGFQPRRSLSRPVLLSSPPCFVVLQGAIRKNSNSPRHSSYKNRRTGKPG